MKNYRWLMALTMLVVLSMACSALSGRSETSGPGDDGGGAGGGTGGGSGSYNTNFPLPDDVTEFTAMGNDAINFQTSLSVSEALDFYREELTARGLTEREINTATTDTTFSIIFDGDPGGKALVVQGVDLGNGKTNVNIRYEDV